MFKKIGITAAAAFLCLAFAQTVSPTTGNGIDGYDAQPGLAAVEQNVNLILPPTVALHLDVSQLDFDMSVIGTDEAPYVCVYGAGYRTDDVDAGIFPPGSGQRQWLPLGTSYGTANTWTTDELPMINIVNAGGLAENYPPASFDQAGELIEGSKNYFVCYQTFILQKFSNHADWDLNVSRAGGQFDMYIQDNSYCSFNDSAPTGFFRIGDGQSINLLPQLFRSGTTGNLAAACGQAGKSWLDDLVVVAVKVNGDPHGTNTAVLTYTISADVP